MSTYPKKIVTLGPVWSIKDLESLTQALVEITKLHSAQYAIELLDHSYKMTMMAQSQYDAVYDAIMEHAK